MRYQWGSALKIVLASAVSVLFLALLGLAACQHMLPTKDSEEEMTMPAIPTIPTPSNPGLEMLVAQAKGDLASRLSVPVDQIEVLEAKAVVWPDASLGCPQPDMRYKQVPMDGVLIRLRAEGQVYEYHSGGSRGLFLCEQPLKLQKDTPHQIDLLAPGSPND